MSGTGDQDMDQGAEVRTCNDALADDLGWGLGMVFRAYVAAAHAAVADLPGGPRGYQVLAAAAQGSVGSQLALAEHLGVDRTVMTYLLDDLEAAGLIERRQDPADRRARRVMVTDTGATLLAALDDRLREAEVHLLAPLDATERAGFRSQVRLLATRIDTIKPVQSACELVSELDAQLRNTDPFDTRSAAESSMSLDRVHANREIGAPRTEIFDVLVDPASHAAIDGTGWVCDSLDGELIHAAGQIFHMTMFHPDHPEGTYEMANLVEVFDPPIAISWTPGYDAADGTLEFGGWTWRYDLTPNGPSTTTVTLTYDWSAVAAPVRDHIGFPPFPPGHLDNSLAHLADLVGG